MNASPLSSRIRRRRSALLAAGAAGAAALLWAAIAEAHHSFSMFDLENNIEIEGVVTTVEWTNPHAWIEVDATNADGEIVHWNVEFNSPNNLTRQGWKRNDIQSGDHVVFVISPLRDGQPGGLFYEVTLPSGEIKRDPRAQAALARAAAASAPTPADAGESEEEATTEGSAPSSVN